MGGFCTGGFCPGGYCSGDIVLEIALGDDEV